MFYLLANNGPQQGRRYELKGDKYILGRHPDCDIIIEVGAVSRNHCQVVRDGQGYAIEDLGSRNGTFVNEEQSKVEGRRLLRQGDVLRVCEVSFTFLSDTPAAAEVRQPTTGAPARMIDGAGLGAFLADDDAKTPGSTVMSKLDVSSSSK